MEKIKVGVIGAGGIAQYAHLPAYQKIAGVEIFAASDSNEEKLKEVREKYNVPHTFSDYKDLLKMKEIGAVSICTPNFLHKEQSISSLQAGKHVLCEKPLGMNTEEVEEVLNEAKRAKKKFMLELSWRFMNFSHLLKQIISSGELGEIYYVKASYLRQRGIPGLGGWFTTRKMSGGGVLIDCGVHFLDFVLWILGNPQPIAVSGSTYQKLRESAVNGGWPPAYSRTADKPQATFDVEELASTLIKLRPDITFFLEASWACNNEPNFSFSFCGTKGGAKISPPHLIIYQERQGSLWEMKPGLPEVNSHEQAVRHFINCIREDKEPLTRPEEILNVAKIMDAIYLSAKQGKEIRL